MRQAQVEAKDFIDINNWLTIEFLSSILPSIVLLNMPFYAKMLHILTILYMINEFYIFSIFYFLQFISYLEGLIKCKEMLVRI